MANKIYDYLKKYIKENLIDLIILILIGVFCFYNTGYTIYKPGGTIDSSNRVTGKNISKSKGSFNMAYVGSLEGRLPIYLFAKLMPEWEIVDNDKITVNDKEDINDTYTRDTLEYQEAISNAKYVALTKAKRTFTITKTNFYVVYITEKNKSGIKVGDELISYDGIKLTSITDFIKYINSKQVNDKIKIEYKRNNRIKETYSIIYEEKSKKYVGISAIKIYKIKSDDNIEVKSKSNESGPSGGLITTLSIYDALIKKDLTKGYKIVGTGTISDDGTVGEIGSVTFKLASAVKDKADIFLCPKENYKDATKYAKKHKYDIIIKEVASFDEAVDYLNKLEEK